MGQRDVAVAVINLQINLATALTYVGALLAVVGLLFSLIAIYAGTKVQETLGRLEETVKLLHDRAVEQVFAHEDAWTRQALILRYPGKEEQVLPDEPVTATVTSTAASGAPQSVVISEGAPALANADIDSVVSNGSD